VGVSIFLLLEPWNIILVVAVSPVVLAVGAQRGCTTVTRSHASRSFGILAIGALVVSLCVTVWQTSHDRLADWMAGNPNKDRKNRHIVVDSEQYAVERNLEIGCRRHRISDNHSYPLADIPESLAGPFCPQCCFSCYMYLAS
jgi:hypothetical protein